MAEEEQPRALKQLALFKKVPKTKKGKKPKPEGFAASLKKGESFNIIDRQPDEASSPAISPRCLPDAPQSLTANRRAEHRPTRSSSGCRSPRRA